MHSKRASALPADPRVRCVHIVLSYIHIKSLPNPHSIEPDWIHSHVDPYKINADLESALFAPTVKAMLSDLELSPGKLRSFAWVRILSHRLRKHLEVLLTQRYRMPVQPHVTSREDSSIESLADLSVHVRLIHGIDRVICNVQFREIFVSGSRRPL